MDHFNKNIDRIDSLAEKLGTTLNTKATKIVGGFVFAILLIFFGFVIFTSKFLRSLFGIKN